MSETLTKPRVHIEVSPGELLDKITILEIKSERIRDAAKLENVRMELAALTAARDAALPHIEGLEALCRELKEANLALWCIEEDIREHERRGYFGASFIILARAVYTKNDHRSRLKRRINELLGAHLVEEKDYRTGMDIA
jgi:hypothetical protein